MRKSFEAKLQDEGQQLFAMRRCTVGLLYETWRGHELEFKRT